MASTAPLFLRALVPLFLAILVTICKVEKYVKVKCAALTAAATAAATTSLLLCLFGKWSSVFYLFSVFFCLFFGLCKLPQRPTVVGYVELEAQDLPQFPLATLAFSDVCRGRRGLLSFSRSVSASASALLRPIGEQPIVAHLFVANFNAFRLVVAVWKLNRDL